MKLKLNEKCPIHRKFGCCGREMFIAVAAKRQAKWEAVRPGVRRIRDEHADHADGYRYKLSPAEMKKVINRKIQDQGELCSICAEPLTDYAEVVPDHLSPRGMGGARRDDRAENIGAAHGRCNLMKASRRNV